MLNGYINENVDAATSLFPKVDNQAIFDFKENDNWACILPPKETVNFLYENSQAVFPTIFEIIGDTTSMNGYQVQFLISPPMSGGRTGTTGRFRKSKFIEWNDNSHEELTSIVNEAWGFQPEFSTTHFQIVIASNDFQTKKEAYKVKA